MADVVTVVGVGDVTSIKMADVVSVTAVGDVIGICQPLAVTGMSTVRKGLQIIVKPFQPA